MKSQQHKKTKLSEFISPSRASLNKTPLCDKIENYDKDAKSLMENELQRRIDNSANRSQRVKKLINEKVHQVLINEITQESARSKVPQIQIEKLEQSYRLEILQNMQDESLSKDMPLQLREIPHPMPLNPRDDPLTIEELEVNKQKQDICKSEESTQEAMNTETSQQDNRKRFLQRVKKEKDEGKKQNTQKKHLDMPLQNNSRHIRHISYQSTEPHTYLTTEAASPKSAQRKGLTSQISQREGKSTTRELNVNAEELKRILAQTKSKVKQTINLKTKALTRNMTATQSLRQSSEMKRYESKQLVTPRKEVVEKTLDPLLQQAKDNAIASLNNINARVLQKFYCRKATQISETDYDIGYLFALIVALVDDSIVMNNGDIKQKAWDDLQRQLSNYGKVVYSLQKLKYVLDNADYMTKSFRKMGFLKKSQQMTAQVADQHESAAPIVPFIEKITIFVNELLNKETHLSRTQNVSRQRSPATFNKTTYIKHTSQRTTPTKRVNTSRNHSRQIASQQNSSKKQETKFTTMLTLKKETINKTYDKEVRQSLEIKKKEDEARQSQLEVARLELEKKKMLALMDKEDLLMKQKQKEQEEIEYLQYQNEMRVKLNAPDQVEVEVQKEVFKEISKEEQLFKTQQRLMKKEQEMQSIQTESQQSQDEKQWKEQHLTKKKQQQIHHLQTKADQLFTGKEKQLREEMQAKEAETDLRLTESLEKANFKFKKLEEQRQSIRKEMEMLQALRQSKKKLM